MAEQLEFYFPKTKSKHMATPTTGKVYPSKGGTVRYGVQASMNGSMSLPKYVKENQFYDYGFGVDSVVRKYPQEFMDTFYDFDSNPTADTQDDETVELAYQVWYQKQAENEVLNAEVNVGEKRVMSRKDYDIDNELSGFSNMEVGDIDLEDYQDEITESVEDEVIEAIRESVDDAMPISDGESISSSVNVDTELEITVPISGDIDYDWTANETYEDDRHDDEWNAEGLNFHGENYQNHLKVVKKAPYGGIGSLFGIGGDTEIGGFSTSELTGSSAIHGDFDSASLNYSGHQNLQVRAEDSPSPSSPLEEVPATVPSPAEPTNESFNAEIGGEVGLEQLKSPEVKSIINKHGIKIVNREMIERVAWGRTNDDDIDYVTFSGSRKGLEQLADVIFDGDLKDTIKNAEKVENDLDYIRKLTDKFMKQNPTIIGEYGPFGNYKLYEHPVRGDTDFLYFYTPAMGGLLVQSALHHKDQMNDKDAAIVSKNLVKLLKQDNLYHTDYFGDDDELNIQALYEGTENVYFAESFNAEMDELDDSSSIIRNQVGDMVGMVELDENDEDIEKVDVDIIDDDGEMAYEGTLGAETFEAKEISRSRYQFTLDDWPIRIHVENCPMNPHAKRDGVYTPKEIAQKSYTVLYNHESLPQFEGNTFGELRKASNGLVVPCNCTINEMKVIKELDPATFTREPDETQEHWDAETFESQGKNTKMILGITALAVGLGLWKGKEIMSISDKISESIKNMRK